jgi:hypothetical protein
MDKIIKLITSDEVNAEVRIRTYTGDSKLKKFFLGSMAPENLLKDFIDVLEHTQVRFSLTKELNFYNEVYYAVHTRFVYPNCDTLTKDVKKLIDDYFVGSRDPFCPVSWKKCYNSALNCYVFPSSILFLYKGNEDYDIWRPWSSRALGTRLDFRIFFKETKEEIVKKTYLFDEIFDRIEEN